MRWWLLVALSVALLGPLEARGDTTTTEATKPVKRTTSAKKRTASAKKRATSADRAKRRAAAKRRAQRKRRRAEAERKPTRRTATNMPRGWRWPPTKTMKTAGARCTDALTEAGVAWEEAPREGKIVTPIVLSSMTLAGVEYHATFRKPPFTMDCHLALALASHSAALYELGVRQVNFGSIFRFTKVRAYGKTKNVLSRHALGLAMDVVSLEDADGNVISVKDDYPRGHELLLSVEDTLNGSGGFRTVLTPRNDPTSHHDHFHVEADISYYDDERNRAALVEGIPAIHPAAATLELEDDDVIDAPATPGAQP
ncbi:MAG: extensin family protein [Kofleriaceae bacterium]